MHAGSPGVAARMLSGGERRGAGQRSGGQDVRRRSGQRDRESMFWLGEGWPGMIWKEVMRSGVAGVVGRKGLASVCIVGVRRVVALRRCNLCRG